MGQVPVIGMIGTGRVAKHFTSYFNMLDAAVTNWSRRDQRPLAEALSHCTHLFLAISDDSIEEFYSQNNQFLSSKHLYHFSGARSFAGIVGIHPLMTFAHQVYSKDDYEKMHFVVDDMPTLNDWPFFMFKNSKSYISTENKARYHALCVISGNFAQMMWDKCEKDLKHLNIPVQGFHHYINQNLKNYLTQTDSLTGPIARGDIKTVRRNLESLSGDAYADVYRAMVNTGELKELI